MTFKQRFALFFSLALVLGASLSAAELIHSPVLSAPAGQDLVVGANLVGADADTRVRLYYRPRGKEIFRSVEMGGTSSDLKGTIPGQSIDTMGLDYYIEASVIKNGQKSVIATSPSANPTLNPHQVVVRKDDSGPEITPLAPGDGETLDTSSPVITVAYNDADSGVNPKSVDMKIDGVSVSSGDIQAFDTMATYVVSKPLADGPHNIAVTVKDNAGNASTSSWKVTVAATVTGKAGGSAKKNAWVWDGKASAETQYGASLSQSNPSASLPFRPYGYNVGKLTVNGHGSDDTVLLDVTKSDAERTDQQPTDRYLATWKNREGQISLGDFSPSFSELSLYNLYQMRGVTADLRSGPINEGHSRFIAVYGQTRRAIESGATGGLSGTADATFAQSVYGARWEVGDQYFQLGTNAVSINDDKDSVTHPGSTLPRYNTVLTSDVRIGLPFMFLTLNGEAGTDYYSDSGILGLSVGSAYEAGLDWNIKPWTSRLKFNFKDLGGNYGFIPGGYTTAADPGLIPDYRGYESSFDQGLFDNQFSLSLGYNNWHDNLQGVKLATTTTNFVSVYTTIAPQEWPSLVVGYSQNTQVNDADGSTTSALGQPNFKLDNKTSIINVGLGYTKVLDAQRTYSLNLNYVRQDYADNSYERLSQDLGGNNTTVSGFYSQGASSFNASVGYGNTAQPGFSNSATGVTFSAAPMDSNSLNTSLRWNEQWTPSVLSSYLGWDLNTNYNNSADPVVPTTITTMRNTFRLGGGWNFTPTQKLSTDWALALLTATDKLAAATTNDTLLQLYSGLKYEIAF